MPLRFTGNAEMTIDVPINAVWKEAIGLEWLSDWDAVEFAGTQGPYGTFTVLDEFRAFRGHFTTFEGPAGAGSSASVAWRIGDGGSGSLRLHHDGAQTRATWTGTAVPHGLDRLFSLALFVIPGNAKRLADEQCGKDLRRLARLAHLRATGMCLVESGVMGRQMAAECPFGGPSADPDSLPELDEAGNPRLEPDERVLSTAVATVVTTAAKAASGQEKFRTLWKSGDQGADLVLTDRRLIYREQNPTGRSYDAFAGQLRHTNVGNLILGDGADYGSAQLQRISATLLHLPQTAVRVHLLLANPGDLGHAWVGAIARWRIAHYPEFEQSAAEHWQTLRSQTEAPQFADGYWGPMAKLPLFCALGSTTPISLPRR